MHNVAACSSKNYVLFLSFPHGFVFELNLDYEEVIRIFEV